MHGNLGVLTGPDLALQGPIRADSGRFCSQIVDRLAGLATLPIDVSVRLDDQEVLRHPFADRQVDPDLLFADRERPLRRSRDEECDVTDSTCGE
jgi:hypothetical protein